MRTREQNKAILSELMKYDFVNAGVAKAVAEKFPDVITPTQTRALAVWAGLTYSGDKDAVASIVNSDPDVDEALLDRLCAPAVQHVEVQAKPSFDWDKIISGLVILIIALPIAYCVNQPTRETPERKLEREIREGQRAVCDKWGKTVEGC